MLSGHGELRRIGEHEGVIAVHEDHAIAAVSFP
jgi:hypothetical protein